MTVEIRVETDDEEAAVTEAHRENRIGLAGSDYVIRRGHRTIGVRARAASSFGARVIHHKHGSADPCPPSCPGYRPG